MLDDLARALEFERRSVELTAAHMTQIDEGWVIRSPALPEVWSHNQVWVNKQISHAAAIELCERHLGDAAFWQLYLEQLDDSGAGQSGEAGGRAAGKPESADERLLERLLADGWELDVEIHMRLMRPPDHPADTTAVIEPAEEDSLELMARWMREDPTLHLSEDGVRQSVDKDRAVWRLRDARRFGIRGPDGGLAAIAQLFCEGPIGQVEHVYTIPEARGRGYARSLVTHAVAQARYEEQEFVFIVADDNDWPKELYKRIGFEPMGRTWLLHLPPATVADRRG